MIPARLIADSLSSDWVNLDQNGNSGPSSPQNAQSPVAAASATPSAPAVSHLATNNTAAAAASASLNGSGSSSLENRGMLRQELTRVQDQIRDLIREVENYQRQIPIAAQASAQTIRIRVARIEALEAQLTIRGIAITANTLPSVPSLTIHHNVTVSLSPNRSNPRDESTLRQEIMRAEQHILDLRGEVDYLQQQANNVVCADEPYNTRILELQTFINRVQAPTAQSISAPQNAQTVHISAVSNTSRANQNDSDSDDTASVASEMPDFRESIARQTQELVGGLESQNRDSVFSAQQAIALAEQRRRDEERERAARQIAEESLATERQATEEANRQRIIAEQRAEAERIRREASERARVELENALRQAHDQRVQREREIAAQEAARIEREAREQAAAIAARDAAIKQEAARQEAERLKAAKEAEEEAARVRIRILGFNGLLTASNKKNLDAEKQAREARELQLQQQAAAQASRIFGYNALFRHKHKG